ncbi:hypothetical protein DPMN_139323 [Dreissena polymorpha]|uniref:Uncharacterized protein n=1 Tax=Dreissena polymorpha TaxID=45954 RepID=A0A9D4G5I9_DREPO|nr:hypothetical protein DPMN_139323 [Dreissena polymorpha]
MDTRLTDSALYYSFACLQLSSTSGHCTASPDDTAYNDKPNSSTRHSESANDLLRNFEDCEDSRCITIANTKLANTERIRG